MGTQGEYNTNKNPDLEVAYTVENIEKCRCPGGPVQTGSQCVSEKLGKLDDVMKAVSSGRSPTAGDVPGVYCSTGIAACKDLNPTQPCICGTCAVWQQYDLVSGKPADYFCRSGMAV